MAYDFLPTLMGGMPSCSTPRRCLVVSLCPLVRRTPSPRISHLPVSLTLSPSPSPHPLSVSFTPSPSPLRLLHPRPSSHHPHPSRPLSFVSSPTVSLGPARSRSPSPSPQKRVLLPLALPLASPAPSSYLRGGVFFSAPVTLQTSRLKSFVHAHVHACAAAQANQTHSRRAPSDDTSTRTFKGLTHVCVRVPSRSHAYLDHPPQHRAHLLDIALMPSTPPRATSTPTPPVCGGIPWEHCKDLNSEKGRFFLMDVNLLDDQGNSPLHSAARSGIPDIVELLLNSGADVSARDISNATPLHEATKSGNLDVVRLLLGHGAGVNAREFNHKTPLHLTSLVGSLDMSRLLIEHGAEINAQDDNGQIPFSIALGLGYRKLARLLSNDRIPEHEA
ncbi:ankyrin repeat-containing domain protein [Russula vinacea]|nr:ankyrin repeat-containing domain protein [Russula vinacea]